MKILLIGAGAIGASVAACLKQNKYDVTVVAKYDEYAKAIREQGLHISGQKGEFVVKMNAVARLEELNDKYDIIFIATKAYDVEENLIKIRQYMKEQASVVSLQNGICIDLYKKYVGSKHTVGCVVGFGATMQERGNITITSSGTLEIGRVGNDFVGKLSEVRECLNSVFPTKIVDNIYESLYSKLIINSCITSLGVITGKTLGVMLKNKTVRNVFIGIIKEAMAVAIKLNIQVPPYANKINYYKIYKRKTNSFITHLIIKIVGKKYKNLKSSSLQSLERGKKTEIDYFNGYIIKLALQGEVNVSLNEQLVNMVKEIEEGKRKFQMENMLDIQYS